MWSVARRLPIQPLRKLGRSASSSPTGKIVPVLRGLLGRAKRPAGTEQSSDTIERQLVQAGTVGSLVFILGASFFFGKSKSILPDEKVWVGPRGPFSDDRAYAMTPLLACLGSALVATTVSSRFPSQIPSVAIAYEVHQLLSVPLTLLVAFRFQGSYDRWWSSRKEIELVATNTIDIAMCCSNNADVLDQQHFDQTGEKRWVRHEAVVSNELRMLGILDALCFFVEEQVMRGNPPHPQNEPEEWQPGYLRLNDEDRARCQAAPDRVLWCMDALVGSIHTAQKLGMLTSELASTMYEKACSVHEHVRQCLMVVHQLTPASFVVHMRTFLFLFCFSFPFTIMNLRPSAITPMSAVVSFSLLGIEFASREMEHPFGEDESDVPCRQILQDARLAIERLRVGHHSPTSRVRCMQQ